MGIVTGRRSKSLQIFFGIAAAIAMAFPASAQDIPAPVCKSTALWENVPGPRSVIQIGDRKLSVPTALYPDANDPQDMFGFTFNVRPDGNLEPDEGDSPTDGWDHKLVIDILDEDRIDDAANTKNMVEILGDPGTTLEKNSDVKGFDVYSGRDFDIYVAQTKAYYLALACVNKMPNYNGPWSPDCDGYRRPWPGASMKFVFGRKFLAVSPVINACISKMLEDFSEPGTGKVTQ